MLTDYARNGLMDIRMRGVAPNLPAVHYIALFTVMPTRSGGGTELSAVGYARIPINSTLTAWSGTQGPGTTGVSVGSSGQMSNNDAIVFANSITAAWDNIVGVGLYDAQTAGNLGEFGYIVDAGGNPITRSFAEGDAVIFSSGTLVIEWS